MNHYKMNSLFNVNQKQHLETVPVFSHYPSLHNNYSDYYE